MDESLESFLETNEVQVNKVLSIFTICLIPFIPLLFLFSMLGVFPELDSFRLLLIWIFITLFSIHYLFFGSKEIPNKFKKYILMLTLETFLFFISITKGINVFLCFGSVVLISCLYFNPSFTGIMTVIAYILMVISLVIRTDNLMEGYYIFTKEKWSFLTIVGISMEFFSYATICMYLSKYIRNLLFSIYHSKKSIQETQNSMIEGFANLIEAKDSNTGGHIKRTSEYVKLICNKLMEHDLYPAVINPKSAKIMVRAAPFHDLGKISIPEEILNKPGKLTPEEFEIIKYHPSEGADFILEKFSPLDDDELIKIAKQMALCHHEHMDGSGYPNGLVGDEIPIPARIMAAADILDALSSKRSYKAAYSPTKSLEIIKSMAGKTLDPIVVYALRGTEEQIKIIADGGIIDYEKPQK